MRHFRKCGSFIMMKGAGEFQKAGEYNVCDKRDLEVK